MEKTISGRRKSECLWAYSFVSIPVLGFLIFSLYPIIWVLFMSFTNYDSVTYEFVEFRNYIRIFSRDMEYWKSVLNTFIIGFGKLLVELPLALLFAYMFTSKRKSGNFFKIAYYLPNVIGVSIVGLVFIFMFSTYNGIINEFLTGSHLVQQSINWFGSKWTAILVISIASIWQGLGTNMLFFSAGLSNIPEELYECAQVDGANGVQKFFKITLPMIAPVAQVICMLAILGTIKMTDLILVLTNGGPAGSTEVMMTNVYKAFFGEGMVNIGYACTKGVISSFVVAGITMVYLWITKKSNEIC